MTSFLRQSTQIVVMVGPYLDKTDGVTEEVGLAGGGTEISKSPGAAFGTGPTLGTHDAEGWYPVTLTTTHTDTVGRLIIKGQAAATHLPVWHEFFVVEEAVYDQLYAGSAPGAATPTSVATVQSTVDNVESGVGIIVQDTSDMQPKFVGITLLNEWLGAIAGKQNADATALAEIKASGAGSGTYDPNTDSVEALRDRGDAAWVTGPTAAVIANAVHDEPIEDHDVQGTAGWAVALGVYVGPDGPGIYVDSGAANTNTVVGTDGTRINPVSTFAAARTIADALGITIYYTVGNSDITLAATHEDWEFIGIGSIRDNVVNLGSQDVDRSLFRNLTLEGTQAGTGRITARDCALQDPGAGTTTFHIFAERCGIVDDILVDTSADNVFDQCYSLAASGVAPIITATGASGSIILSHYGGKIELKSLSASHNIELDGHGHLTFNADCNVNANLDVHGTWDVTDNTAGMSDLATMSGLLNLTKINAEVDTGLSDYDGPTKGEMDTAHALLAVPGDAMDLIAGAIITTTYGAGARDAAGQATDAEEADADALLTRNIAGGSNGTRSVQDALRVLRNKVTIAGGTMTVKKEDDSTTAWTGAVATSAGDPISEIDPA